VLRRIMSQMLMSFQKGSGPLTCWLRHWTCCNYPRNIMTICCENGRRPISLNTLQTNGATGNVRNDYLCLCFACRFGAETFTLPGIFRDKSVSCTNEHVKLVSWLKTNTHTRAVLTAIFQVSINQSQCLSTDLLQG